MLPDLTRTREAHTYAFPIELTTENDGTYSVIFPDLPGCITWGKTHDDAIVNAAEAATLHLEGFREHGGAIPEPSAPTVGQAVVLVRA